MEFITLWKFSQSWVIENLPNLYWANVEVAAKHSVMEVFLWLSYFPIGLGGGVCLEKTQETPKHLISTYRAPKKTSQHIKIFLTRKIRAELRYLLN